MKRVRRGQTRMNDFRAVDVEKELHTNNEKLMNEEMVDVVTMMKFKVI